MSGAAVDVLVVRFGISVGSFDEVADELEAVGGVKPAPATREGVGGSFGMDDVCALVAAGGFASTRAFDSVFAFASA